MLGWERYVPFVPIYPSPAPLLPSHSGDNGTMYFWDWRSGYNFQKFQTQVQPGSIDSEAGIFDLQFDMSGSRLMTAEADKTIKIYKEDETAVSDLARTRVNKGVVDMWSCR